MDNYQKLRQSIQKFESWLASNGFYSHDPYDLWGTSWGLKIRELYYKGRHVGKLLAGILTISEILVPKLIRMTIKKQRFATADAQIGIAFLNMFMVTRDNKYLSDAEVIAKYLVDNSVTGFQGMCWGYPFDWYSNKGLWKKHTPFITTTPYCFELFLKLLGLTQKKEYYEYCQSIANFVLYDLNHTTHEVGKAGSYSPFDSTKVINASAYRSWILYEWYNLSGNKDALRNASENLEFILGSQNSDGSWWYALENKLEQFIDNFHTCFVLKNLIKINKICNDERINKSVESGYKYYSEYLLNNDLTPKPFSIKPRLQFTSLETYAYAEGITLHCLLKHLNDDLFEKGQLMCNRAIDSLQTKDGFFSTRVYLGFFKAKYPFLRWPQAQMYLALSNILLESSPILKKTIEKNVATNYS